MSNEQRVFSRFIKLKAIKICLGILGILVLFCILAPWLAPWDPNLANPGIKFAPVSLSHPLGTDYLGRDLLSRLLWGGRNTLGYAGVVTALSAVTGTLLGMLAGGAGGWIDGLLMKGSDVLRSFPGVVLVLIIVSLWGAGIWKVCAALLLTRWIWYGRMARNLTKSQMARSSVMASRLAGSSWFKILRRHIFAAILPEMLSVLAIDFGSTLLAISGYSFLGLGILPPKAEWGMMINDGRNYMDHPGMMLWPGICVVLIVISVNFLGDKLRDLLEEKRI